MDAGLLRAQDVWVHTQLTAAEKSRLYFRGCLALCQLHRRDGFRQSEPWEVVSPLGRRMAGPRLTKGEPGVAFSGAAPTRMWSTAALAFSIQAAGAELLKETLGLLMPRLWSELPGVRLCHVIHDEIFIEAPEAMAQAAADLLLEVMQDPGLQTRYLRDVLPLVAEVHLGTSWAETH